MPPEEKGRPQRYEALALVYDRLVAGVDFAGWADYTEEILAHHGARAASVVDLACGTGNTALPMAARGYRVTGVDISAAMLAVARDKAQRQGVPLDLLQADMRLFALPAPVDLVTCFHDGLNYLAGPLELARTFARVRDALKPGGCFIFDLNALAWLAACPARGETVLAEEDWGLTWRSTYDPQGPAWEINLSGWIGRGNEKTFFTERHRERGFTPAEATAALARAGLEHLAVYHPFTLAPAGPGSRRHFYAARRPL